MTEAELNRLASTLKLIIDPDIALFLELGGEAVGLAIALPDINLVLKRMRGRLLPFGLFHLLNRDRIINRARLPILGVLPRHRNRGFELVLMDEIARRGSTKYHQAECSWILEDNDAMNKGIAATGAHLLQDLSNLPKSGLNAGTVEPDPGLRRPLCQRTLGRSGSSSWSRS